MGLPKTICRTQRRALLDEIYAPLNQFKKKSKEWYELFNSGKVWKDYYHPFEWRTKDYEYQEKNIHHLKEIDNLRTKIPTMKSTLQNMIVNFSQKSCAIEGNTLELSESQEIWDRLRNYDLDALLIHEKFPLPSSISSSDKPEEEIIEIPGKFRTMVMQSYGDHLTVYPYPEEIPKLMDEFINFHDESKNIDIHPIMISCRLHASLAHIHPFYDGNGRVSRLIMAKYLIRNGYLPAIFHQVKREDYIDSLRKTQKEKDASMLYDIVISEILSSYKEE
ncbi:Fic family protein [Rhizophagus clarus]|uniref:Fic family protein n=1 Tax=Rhizophagus clarus TaxID=94130 RepID=A0A8H3QNE1_9GLOM|nr:Fic family protein [Rhizophagus clarus]